MEDSNTLLFNWIYSVVFGEGGDGDAIIGFKIQDFREVATQWRKLLPDYWRMENYDDHVMFIDNQEFIILTSAKHFDDHGNWGPRILTW